MEILIGLILILGLFVWGVSRIARTVKQAVARPAPTRRVVMAPRPTAEHTRRRANAQARAFQIALIQLSQAPDFRRAATLVAAASLVPVAFRRRQFSRFRPQLCAHYRRCIAAGADRELLVQSLRELVTALGVAAFEADYIQRGAEARLQQTPAAATPVGRMAALRQDHEARLAGIRQGVGQDAELIEQLLEAEGQRYRDALLTLVDDRSASTPPA